MRKVDVAIIGAGSAGLSARREVAKKTDNYVVIDDGILGTTCARVGCMPSKVLIQVANDYDRRNKFAEQGIHGQENLQVNYVEVMQHVRKLRDRFVRSVMQGMDSWVDEKYFIRKRAKFLDDHTLAVGDEKIVAEKIIIATGSRPIIPQVFEKYSQYVIDTETFFEQESLPKTMAVIGLGVIGIELGQALHRLGVKVSAITRRKSISGLSDPDLCAYVTKKFAEQMDIYYGGVESVHEENGKLNIMAGGKAHIVEKVLVATGRRPGVLNLGLENTKAQLNKHGVPEYNHWTFQVNGAEHLFITGDSNGDKQMLHEASDEGRIAGFNAVNPVTQFQTRTPLGITFCDPNIAFVGKRFHQLLDEGTVFEVGEVSFEGQGRSIVKLKEIGMLRVYGRKSDGLLLGAELFAPDGEHLAHLLAWIVSQKMTVGRALALPFYHPVVEEGLRTALRNLRDKVEEEQPPIELYPKHT